MIIQLLRNLAVDCNAAQVNNMSFCTNLPHAGASSANLQHLLQIVIGTLAAIAVLIIVIAGLNLVAAGGDPQKVAKARGTIIYALIGLVVAISAEAIVTFVLGNVG